MPIATKVYKGSTWYSAARKAATPAFMAMPRTVSGMLRPTNFRAYEVVSLLIQLFTTLWKLSSLRLQSVDVRTAIGLSSWPQEHTVSTETAEKDAEGLVKKLL